MTCDSLQERAGRGLSDDTNHVAVRAHGEATEANKDRRHQNLSAPDILIFNTNFPPPKMYECARLQNVRVGEICVKTTSYVITRAHAQESSKLPHIREHVAGKMGTFLPFLPTRCYLPVPTW